VSLGTSRSENRRGGIPRIHCCQAEWQEVVTRDRPNIGIGYTCVATGVIAGIQSPLDLLSRQEAQEEQQRPAVGLKPPAAMSRPALEVADIFRK
jgi:hypothetical protein